METWPCDTNSITAAMDKSGLNINKERYFETFVHIKFKSYYWYGSLYAEYAKQQPH